MEESLFSVNLLCVLNSEPCVLTQKLKLGGKKQVGGTNSGHLIRQGEEAAGTVQCTGSRAGLDTRPAEQLQTSEKLRSPEPRLLPLEERGHPQCTGLKSRIR